MEKKMVRGVWMFGVAVCLSSCGYQMVSPEDSLKLSSLSEARVEVFDNQSVEPGLGAACSVALRRQLGVSQSTETGAALVFEGEVLSIGPQVLLSPGDTARRSSEAEVVLRVQVRARREQAPAYEGRVVTVSRVYQSFGEPAAVNAERRRATVEACEEAMMVVAQDVHMAFEPVSKP